MSRRPPSHRTDTSIVLTSEKALRWQLVAIALLLALSTLFQGLDRLVPDSPVAQAARLTYIDGELTLPALYSTLALFAASGLLAAVRQAADVAGEETARWTTLATIFFLLALDEALGIHETTIDPVRELLGIDGGLLWFAWIVPASIALCALGAYLVPFLLRLPVATRRSFVLSAVLFVAGAIGLESLGGTYLAAGENEVERYASGGYVAIATVEEGLELVGVAVFVSSLIGHLQRREVPWRLSVTIPRHIEGS